MSSKKSETKTENLFRGFYGSQCFIEKGAIPSSYGFTSKNKRNTESKGYPDFFLETEDYCIIVEAKADDQDAAQEEVKHYMTKNNIRKDIIGIAISGQDDRTLKVTYYAKLYDKEIFEMPVESSCLLKLEDLRKLFIRSKIGESVSNEALIKFLKRLNEKFNENNKIRDTDRSLFFSGLMIALKNNTFRNTYERIQAPAAQEVSTASSVVLESHDLNDAILKAIKTELITRTNKVSREMTWEDRFSFIKTVDYSIEDYKKIIRDIETNVFLPFQNEEKQDILGRAYKIFLSRAGKIDNKNIILTPDHIKSLMVKLARLSVDDVILDTCTGTGGFLMESMETLISLAKNNPAKIKNIKEKQLIGFEIDSVLFTLACSNMFLHGDGRTNLIYRSSLLDNTQGGIVNSNDNKLLEYIRGLRPTKVIINPPYENNNPIKFTKQALDYLENNGKLVIIMPTLTLVKNQKLTEDILKVARLEAVIEMPQKLFSEQKRTVYTSIFIFTKTPHNKDDDVLFYSLEDDGFVSIQHRGRIDKNNSWNSIEQNVLDAVNNKKEIAGLCEKRKIYRGDELNCSGVREWKNTSRQLVQIKDLFDIQNGTLQSEKNIEGEYPFITADENWKTHNNFALDAEAIVYAVGAAGSLGKSHYVKGKFTASNLCLVLTKKKDSKFPIDMQFYNCYFKSIRKQLVSDLKTGSSKLIIKPDSFKEYRIEYVPLEEQRKFVSDKLNRFIQARNSFMQAEKQLHDAIEGLAMNS